MHPERGVISQLQKDCMKVILLRDVAKIGRKGSVVEVPDGFALNKLIPKKDAVAATPLAMKQHTVLLAAARDHKETKHAALAAQALALTTPPLTIPMTANDQGHLFESVHAGDVVRAALLRGVTLLPEEVEVNGIKSVGAHTIMLTTGAATHAVPVEVVAK